MGVALIYNGELLVFFISGPGRAAGLGVAPGNLHGGFKGFAAANYLVLAFALNLAAALGNAAMLHLGLWLGFAALFAVVVALGFAALLASAALLAPVALIVLLVAVALLVAVTLLAPIALVVLLVAVAAVAAVVFVLILLGIVFVVIFIGEVALASAHGAAVPFIFLVVAVETSIGLDVVHSIFVAHRY